MIVRVRVRVSESCPCARVRARQRWPFVNHNKNTKIRKITEPSQNKHRPAAQAALRVAVHSAVYAPFSVAAFVAWVALREDSGSIVRRVKQNTFKLWASGTIFWVNKIE